MEVLLVPLITHIQTKQEKAENLRAGQQSGDSFGRGAEAFCSSRPREESVCSGEQSWGPTQSITRSLGWWVVVTGSQAACGCHGISWCAEYGRLRECFRFPGAGEDVGSRHGYL